MTEKKKYLRCIRLDQSDASVFERPAEPGEPAVSGAFLFQRTDIAKLAGPRLQAFRNGFLGVASMGWCTLVSISESDDPALEEALAMSLAKGMVREFGAPDSDSVIELAREEMRYARSLCDGAVDTVLATQRTHSGGEITEQFHALAQNAAGHDDLKIWDWMDQET